MKNFVVFVTLLLWASLALMVILDGCSTPPRLARSSVAMERASLQSYFDSRLQADPFRANWYDSAAIFAALDTVRTKPFAATVTRFRPIDSTNAFSAAELRFRESILLHDLNILSLTADSTQ